MKLGGVDLCTVIWSLVPELGGQVLREPVAKPAFGLVFCLKPATIHSKGGVDPRTRNWSLTFRGGKQVRGEPVAKPALLVRFVNLVHLN